jgi:arylsulfatase A-like enzyme
MPTVKDLLGVKYRDSVQGKSWLPILRGTSTQDRILYFDQLDMQLEPGKVRQDKALVMNGYKLMLNFRRNKGIFSLFDLNSDPQENVNLYEQGREIAGRMYQEILKRKEINEKRKKTAIEQTAAEIDFKEMSEENIEKLKALGYIK